MLTTRAREAILQQFKVPFLVYTSIPLRLSLLPSTLFIMVTPHLGTHPTPRRTRKIPHCCPKPLPLAAANANEWFHDTARASDAPHTLFELSRDSGSTWPFHARHVGPLIRRVGCLCPKDSWSLRAKESLDVIVLGSEKLRETCWCWPCHGSNLVGIGGFDSPTSASQPTFGS